MTDEPKIRITGRSESQVRQYGTQSWMIEGFMVIDGMESTGLTHLEVPYRVWSRIRAGTTYTLRLHSEKR